MIPIISTSFYFLIGESVRLLHSNPRLFFRVTILICYIWNRSCVPLHNFDYIYQYLINTNISYVDWWVIPTRLYFLHKYWFRDMDDTYIIVLVSALTILVRTETGGIRSTCYPKLRWKTSERVLRYPNNIITFWNTSSYLMFFWGIVHILISLIFFMWLHHFNIWNFLCSGSRWSDNTLWLSWLTIFTIQNFEIIAR